MGLKSAVQNAVEGAINALGDLAESITYNQKSAGTYNATTGAITTTTTSYTLKAVLLPNGDKIDANTNDGKFTGDMVCIFASNDLSVAPSTNDTITRSSEEFKINSIQHDPAIASYTLVLTRIG